MIRNGIALLGVAASCCAPFLAAQSPSHEIPLRGAALYDREYERKTRVLEPDPSTLRNQNVREIPNQPGAGVVLHSDLDDKGRGFRRPPTKLLEIPTYVAYDLSTIGKKKLEFDLPLTKLYGALHGKGVIERDDSGIEHIRLDIETLPPAKRTPKPQCELKGQLRIARLFDPYRCVVTQMDCKFHGEIHFLNRNKPDQIRRASFEIRDNWQLREIVDNRGREFSGRVQEAIRRGAANLKKVLEGDLQKKYSPTPDNRGETRRSGELALILLTLLRAGESRTDPIIAKALADLKQRHIRDTYSLGVALLAMEACYTPIGEREALISGELKTPYPRLPTAEDKEIIEQWIAQLLGNRTDRNPNKPTSWHYVGGPGFDNSCTQYAVLGLYAAHLCGVEVDRDIWIGAARHFLEEQCDPTEKVRLRTTTHQQLAKNRAGRGTVAATDAAGWHYANRENQATGSMTTAGVSSLTICDAVLHQTKRRPKEVSSNRLRAAMKSGLAWLELNYEVRTNPGADSNWRLYYLYGLERACELNRIAYLGKKDWYFDGATLLIEEQNDNGRWGNEIDTSFAILFLMKAALPAISGKR